MKVIEQQPLHNLLAFPTFQRQLEIEAKKPNTSYFKRIKMPTFCQKGKKTWLLQPLVSFTLLSLSSSACPWLIP